MNPYFHTMDFTYKITNKGTYAIVEMSGNLIDKNQATPLLDEIQEFIGKGINSFVISMETFRYLNSNGLNVLVNILTKSRKNGGDTTICCISDKIKEQFGFILSAITSSDFQRKIIIKISGPISPRPSVVVM